jgi:hypothetical protein
VVGGRSGSRVSRPARPGNGCQLRTELNGQDLAAAFGKRRRRLAGSRADLQDVTAGTEIGQLGHVVEQGRWVARSSPVIQLGGLVERRPQALAIGS